MTKLKVHHPHRERKYPFWTRLDLSLHWSLSLALVVCTLALVVTWFLNSPRTVELASLAARIGLGKG